MKKIFTFLISLIILITPAYVYAEGEENQENNDPNQNQQVDPQNNESEVIDNTLSEIKVTGGTLTPTFNKTTYKYTITDINPETFNIDYTQSSPNKTLVVKNPGNLTLENIANSANKTGTITVTYTDNENNQHTNTYEITVDYEVPKKSTYLTDLSVTGYQFDKKFNKDTSAYSFEIPNEVDIITIKATAEDENAKITYDGNTSETVKIQKVGEESHIKVVVTVGTDTRTYYLNVTRALPKEESDETEEEKSLIEDTIGTDDSDEPKTKQEKEIEERIAATPNINPILNRITVTLAAIVGMGLGGFGIYIYAKTSPKSMKKDIIKFKNDKAEKPESSIVEVKKEDKMEIKDDLVETKEFIINNTNKDA